MSRAATWRSSCLVAFNGAWSAWNGVGEGTTNPTIVGAVNYQIGGTGQVDGPIAFGLSGREFVSLLGGSSSEWSWPA